jgi:hypothetical protein
MDFLASMTFVSLNAKFGGDFTLKGRFDSGKTRAHYVLMPLCDPAHWSCYNRVLQGSNVPMAEVVAENGYRMHDVEDGPCNYGAKKIEKNLGLKGKELRVTWIWMVS